MQCKDYASPCFLHMLFHSFYVVVPFILHGLQLMEPIYFLDQMTKQCGSGTFPRNQSCGASQNIRYEEYVERMFCLV
jgi:hypothetical protein